jgi:tetratricopeptide (TPR) repeat protein
MEAFIIITWVALAILVGALARDKKIGGGGAFLIALIFSPLIGLLAAILSPQRKQIDPRAVATNPEAQRLFARGESAIRKRNYDEAIARFESVLQIQPFAPATNYYLAKLYSIKHNKTKAFKHLTVAINQGFADFADMTSSPALTFLRNQPEFRDYAERGYKALPDSPTVQTATIARVSAPASPVGTSVISGALKLTATKVVGASEVESRQQHATPVASSADIRFNCPRCGQHLIVEQRGAGMAVNCPNCNEQIEIPRSTAPLTPPPKPPQSLR